MKYHVVSYPTKPGVFCSTSDGYYTDDEYSNKKKAFQRASKLKNGQDWTEVAVLSEDNEGAYAVIGGYIADKWEGSEYLKGHKFTSGNVPEYIERKFEDFSKYL